MNISELIPEGYDNAVSLKDITEKAVHFGLVKPTNNAPRTTRALIHNARRNEAILNLQDGRGYFKPTADDIDKLSQYLRQEKNRIIGIAREISHATKLLEDMREGRLDG